MGWRQTERWTEMEDIWQTDGQTDRYDWYIKVLKMTRLINISTDRQFGEWGDLQMGKQTDGQV